MILLGEVVGTSPAALEVAAQARAKEFFGNTQPLTVEVTYVLGPDRYSGYYTADFSAERKKR